MHAAAEQLGEYLAAKLQRDAAVTEEAKIAEMQVALASMREHLTNTINTAVHTIATNGESRVVKIYDRLEPLSQCVHDLAGRFGELSTLVHDILTRMPASQRKG